MKFVFSEKGKTNLIIDNLKFDFQKNLAGSVQRWIRTKRACNAYVKMIDDYVLFEQILSHNHEMYDNGNILRQQLINSLKRKGKNLISFILFY